MKDKEKPWCDDCKERRAKFEKKNLHLCADCYVDRIKAAQAGGKNTRRRMF